MQRHFNADERLGFLKPNAESTMNGTFQWGRKDFNNSSITQNSKSAKSPQRCLKIDARVYTDIQSRGLASRIVKYHENGTRFNRSISLTNLSGKNSPLSVKKLEAKPQLRYDKAVKQNVSMTHIAPPDKSLFYGNTLSGLLRSSSVITLQQNDDDLSSENRPIIHPPVTEKELQPTRSVLEVLKEISRKRINNEVSSDSDETAENSKKYCGRLVDTAHFSGNDYRLQQMQTTPPPLPPPTYKRQRESTVDGYVTSCFSCDANSYQQKSQQQAELPASPEQQSKRRYCNYNNDITSSLSSSAKSSTSKRKLYEHDGYKRQEKLLRYQSEVRLPEISTVINNDKLPITSLPNSSQTVSNEITMPAVVKKSASAPLPTVADAQKVSVAPSAAVKPKLTLFNRNYETKVDVEQATLDSNEDDNAYAGINFVKPKKSATSIGGNSASNLVMQRTRKSKLALMLSGLRGELYLGDKEEEQRLKGATSSETNEDKQKDLTTQQQQPPTIPITTNAFNNKQNSNVFDKPDAIEKTTPPAVSKAVTIAATTITAAVSATTTQPKKITSPLTGIKLTPMTTTTTAATNTVTTDGQTKQATPVALNFNFGLSAATAAPTPPSLSFAAPVSTTNVTPASTTATTSFSFGVPSTATAAKPAPILQFTPPATTSALSIVASNPITTNTTTPTFNFNLGAATKNPTSTAVTSAQTATASAGFTFGSNASNAASTTTTSSTTTSATTAFSFGGLTATHAADKSATTNSNVKPAVSATAATFNFNSNKPATALSFGANPNATNEASKMFSFSSTPKTVNPIASGAFAFGSSSNNTLDNKTAQTTAPFGGGANLQATSTPPTFGLKQADQTNKSASTNSFMFGAKPANQTSIAPVAFGANTAPTQAQENKIPSINSFLFGSSNSTATKPSFGATNINNNSAGLFGLNTGNSAATITPALAAATTTTDNANTTNAFSFSNAAAQSKAFNFGTANTTTNNAVSDATKSGNLFGAALGNNQQSKPFCFGNQNVAATTISEPPKAVNAGNTLNFSNANPGNNNTFTLTGDANSNKPAITNAFGAAAATTNKQNGGAFAFGQINNNAPATGGIFNFGTSQTNANSSTDAANQVASNKSTTNKTNTFGGFATNTSSSSGGFVFGANAGIAAKAPSFCATSSTNAPSGGFVFGAMQQQKSSAATTTPAASNLFASANAPAAAQSGNLFGAASNPSATTSNIFGGNANATSTFGGASAAVTTGTTNLSTVSSSSDRQIRRATRRLTKT